MRLFGLLFITVVWVVTKAQGNHVVLDTNVAYSLCNASTNPCLFSNTEIWIGGVAPVNGDYVTMLTTPEQPIFINLALGITLRNVTVEGIDFMIDTQEVVTFNSLSCNFSDVRIRDAQFQTQQVNFTSSTLTLSGAALMNVTKLRCERTELTILDGTTLTGTVFVLGSLNATEQATFIAQNVTFYQDFTFDISIEGTVRIGNLYVDGTVMTANSNQMQIGLIRLHNKANFYLYGENNTFASLTSDYESEAFFAGTLTITGLVNAEGPITLFDGTIVMGNENFKSSVENIEFLGYVNATFYNTLFTTLETPEPASGVRIISLNLIDCSFSAIMSIAANVTANGLTVLGVGTQINGTVNSIGDLNIMPGGILTAAQLNQTGGTATIFGTLEAAVLSFTNTTVELNNALVGNVIMFENSALMATSPTYLTGHATFSSSSILAPNQLVNITGAVACVGNMVVSANVVSTQMRMAFGTMVFQGSWIADLTINFKLATLLVQSPSTLNSQAINSEQSTISLNSTLTVQGPLFVRDTQFTSIGNPLLQVNGSMYSFGNCNLSVPLVVDSFSFIGNSISLSSAITSSIIGFSGADVIIGANAALNGNVSLLASYVKLGSPLTISGGLLMQDAEITATAPNQPLVVAGPINSVSNAFIFQNVSVYTPFYNQSGGTLHLSGGLSGDLIQFTKGTVLSVQAQTVISGNITAPGGTLGFHASAVINGSVTLDGLSQFMVFHNIEAPYYPIINVTGVLALHGSLVYWITPAPAANAKLSYTLLRYNTLQGKFDTYDSYAPNFQLIALRLEYVTKQKEIHLVYNNGSKVSPGVVAGIAIGSMLVVMAVIFGFLYYRKYFQLRRDYSSLN